MTEQEDFRPPLPEGWAWFGPMARHVVDGGVRTGVMARIGPTGIEVFVVDDDHMPIPWKVFLAVKDFAIAQARTPSEALRARADDLRPTDCFVTGDRVRYVGDRSDTRIMPDKNIGATGTVTGFSTPKYGWEHVKFQSVLVTWDEESARPGITIEGRETMVQSYELEAMEVH
jgi:hypothetical protein